MKVRTHLTQEDLDVLDATFTCPDLTTFTGVDDLALTITGQRPLPGNAVLACDVTPGGGRLSVLPGRLRQPPRGSVIHSLAHVPFGWRPTVPRIRVRVYRCAECGPGRRQDTSAAAVTTPAMQAASSGIASPQHVQHQRHHRLGHQSQVGCRRPPGELKIPLWASGNLAASNEGVATDEEVELDGVAYFALVGEEVLQDVQPAHNVDVAYELLTELPLQRIGGRFSLVYSAARQRPHVIADLALHQDASRPD
ncbi:hypothetical protein KEM60_00805 [Austwickia sp. TVS 96-490-7B]|nr:hypothetical protein [Austwickia sp. TVS 96-490-7B]MBW3084616.1 hypothetical protein [Austwickia sp. TVS 96-490-7B]